MIQPRRIYSGSNIFFILSNRLRYRKITWQSLISPSCDKLSNEMVLLPIRSETIFERERESARSIYKAYQQAVVVVVVIVIVIELLRNDYVIVPRDSVN